MACLQNPRKKDIELVTQLAHQFAEMIGEPVRIYRSHCISIGEYFDFEPAYLNNNRDTIKIINVSVLS